METSSPTHLGAGYEALGGGQKAVYGRLGAHWQQLSKVAALEGRQGVDLLMEATVHLREEGRS